MYRFSILGSVLLCTALLSACASTSSYQPAKNDRSMGYTDYAIESNRYRVVYRANSQASADDLALRRAAELTVHKGQDWFQVINRSHDLVGDSGASPRVSLGTSTGGGNVRFGGGIGFSLGGSSGTYLTSLEIVTGTGVQPVGTNVYDARSVIENTAAY